MKRSTLSAVLFSVFSLMLWSCSKEAKTSQVSPTLPSTPYDYGTDHKGKKTDVVLWQIGTWHPTTETISEAGSAGPFASYFVATNAGATLGRVIFYDNGSTININHNCSGCHSAPPAIGSVVQTVRRNNIDLAAVHAEAGIVSADELIARMKNKAFYLQLFKDAYGTSEITPERITDALSQYMTAMSGVSSREALPADPRFADPFK